MEDVGYYVTCILTRILLLQAWQCLTGGRTSSHIHLLVLRDLIRENAHHSLPILSANNYKALQASCKDSKRVQKKDFFFLDGIRPGLTSARAIIREHCNLMPQSHQTWLAWNAIQSPSRRRRSPPPGTMHPRHTETQCSQTHPWGAITTQ